MPPQKLERKRMADTPAPAESNKKQKGAPATPKKAGPVLDLASTLPKARF